TSCRSDWSSDVCSSDLVIKARGETSELVCNHFLKKLFTIFFGRDRRHSGVELSGAPLEAGDVFGIVGGSLIVPTTPHYSLPFEEIGRASCRVRSDVRRV